MILSTVIYAATCLSISHVNALTRDKTDASVTAVIDSGTFMQPAAQVRPFFRYWIPDASVDHEILAADVKAAADVGSGGFEALGFYLYNDGAYAPSDWVEYGWGTPAWQRLVQSMARAHKDNGVLIDFPMGPNQGQGVPAPENSDGLAWDLFLYNISIPLGGSFDGILPGMGERGISSLHAVITGTVVGSENITIPPLWPGIRLYPPTYADFYSNLTLPGTLGSNHTRVTLSTESLKVVTNQVSPEGGLKIQFEAVDKGFEHKIFVIYLDHSGWRAQNSPSQVPGPQSVPQTWIQNGSWAVDHFSALGAKTTTDFWEQYVLTNGTRELLMEVGNYGWEDSVELHSNLQWTRDLPLVFSTMHGYDLTKWLPLLFHQNKIAWIGEPKKRWVTDEPDHGNSHIADYRTTVGYLYGVYLKTLTDWMHDYMNLQFSAQIGYNLPMDMLQNIPVVDAPECESLGFTSVDAHRQYSGPANLAGKRVISSEIGAGWARAYEQTYPELLLDVKLGIAGSVNRFVFHGFPYSGDYGNTTWPGFTTFNYHYAGQHGPRDPGWEYFSDAVGFTSRLCYIFQLGIPKSDLVLYQKITGYPLVVRSYAPTDLEEMGYSYEYISPENFNLPEAYVKDAVFAPDRQAFKAMIVRANDSMTAEGVLKLAHYAQEGLPLIFLGGLPTSLLTYVSTEKDLVSNVLGSIESLPNVHVVAADQLVSTIESVGITPLTKVSANATWYTRWRKDEVKGLDYVFIYNGAPKTTMSEGTVEFASAGIPYSFDAWTGERTPILNYTQTNCSTKIFFRLAVNQSTVVVFSDSPINGISLPPVHVVTADPGVIGLTSTRHGVIALSVYGSSEMSVTTSKNMTYQIPPAPGPSFALGNWSLMVESWEPPSNFSEIRAVRKTNTTTYSLASLTSWQAIDGLENVSGIGFYSTTFTWPPPNATAKSHCSSVRAMVDFGAIFHTLRVKINGHSLPPLDVTWATADISNFLVEGSNTVEVTVATTLLNVLRLIWKDLRSSGRGPTKPTTDPNPAQHYGILHDAIIMPYCATTIV